jgi:hypothetical protein
LTCPALIDFEASCLPEFGQSFPIEVAVARVDGRSAAWLIRPAEAWKYWDWSDDAEKLHGISREMLEQEGLAPARVIAEMQAFVQDCDVYADADLDEYWLEVLCHTAGANLPFPVRYLGEFMQDRGYSRAQVVGALDRAKRLLPQEHLAREDAKRLAMAVKFLMENPPDS